MKHLGNICKLNGAMIEPVDLVTGDSPCQDLSIAGKREGLDGQRSGLFMEMVRVIKEMRDETDGAYPRFMLWENVPGAFSSNKGEDFRAVLEETAKIADSSTVVPRPPQGKWTNAGCIMADGWSVAWRVLDAQFWGVPQRRRRIALVADFRGLSAPEVLFERKGVPGDSPQSKRERERVTSDIESGIDKAIAFENHGKDVRYTKLEGVFPTTTSNYGTGGNNQPFVVSTFGHQAYDKVSETSIAASLKASGGILGGGSENYVAYGITAKASNSMKSDNPHSGFYVAETSRTLDGTGGSPSCNQGGIAIASQSQVRRLTPLECERLQGFPDNWTYIPPQKPTESDIAFWREVWNEWCEIEGIRPKTDSQIKTWLAKDSPDNARYKAIGNSIALPPWRFVLGRIYEQGARTLGSLFDGIGGFPFVWLELGGRAVWASEVEPFPIKVTRSHFNITEQQLD